MTSAISGIAAFQSAASHAQTTQVSMKTLLVQHPGPTFAESYV